jgi:hypothetical protein
VTVDRLRLVTDPLVADEDVVVAVRQGHPGLIPDGDVLAQALLEGLGADGGVVAAGDVAFQRRRPARRIVVAGAITL